MKFNRPYIPAITALPLAPVALAIALALPGGAQAISIGEIALQSSLGQPLLAQVDVKSGSGENIENNCLSLAAPEAREEDARSYLTKARLSIRMEGARQYVLISTSQPFNEPFAKLRLQVKCPGMGSVIKTLTILPDMDESIFQSLTTTFDLPVVATAPTQTSAGHIIRAEAPAPSPETANQPADMLPQPRHRRSARAQPSAEYRQVVEQGIAGKAAQFIDEHRAPEEQRAPAPRRVREKEKQDEPSTFKLKLSGDPFDESRIGKITPQEREILLARQKLLDADDQTASFLALKNQVKQLQDELGTIKLQLASAPAPTAAPAAQPAIAAKKITSQSDLILQRSLIVAGLLGAMLALLLWLRRHTRNKSRLAAAPILKQPIVDITDSAVSRPSAYTPIKSTPVKFSTPAQLAESAPAALRQPPKSDEEWTDEDAVLEEAELYAEHGHPDKAIALLQGEIIQYPAHTAAWELLLSIFSSLGKAAEFEQTAQNFFNSNQDGESRKKIQALGRTLDPDNPLYASDAHIADTAAPAHTAPKKQRPIGNVLVEMGAMSELDLQDCLKEFDSKVHGRFGGYLISRRMITLAQLNEALLLQQSEKTAEAAGQPAADANPDTTPVSGTEKGPSLDLDFAPTTAVIQPLHIEFEASEEKIQVQDLDFDFEQPAAKIHATDSGALADDFAQNKPVAQHGKVQHNN